MILDSVINFAPVLGVVWNWIKKIVSTRVGMFLVLKATIFFLFLKFLPLLLGKFYQWIYDLGVSQMSSYDLSAITGYTMPQITGLAAWILLAFKINVVVDVLIAGAVTRLTFRALPFFR
ncbi:MAG: hypothetical protein D3908_03590 [Candidatus Electrothrix sp. AUS4]|nr:hypothetical protein [Candidatus Electrothrix sp. AUS4]